MSTLSGWMYKKVNEMTLQDACDAHSEGVNFICGDGKLGQITSNPRNYIYNILSGKVGK